jgi:YhcH/YjgK/YiaL family protein
VIIDRLEGTTLDRGLPAGVRRAFEYLRTADLLSAPVGRLEIDGDRLFALLQDYDTRPAAQCVWEAHRKYTDVQYIVRGVERMGYLPLAGARERQPYDADRDVALYEPGSDYVTVHAGMFAIFTPRDVHSPSVAAGEPAAVRKVVLKVLGDWSG